MKENATLLSAVFEGLKRSRRQWAVAVPAPFAPISLNSTALPSPDDQASFADRRRLFAALAASGCERSPDAIMRTLVHANEWDSYAAKRQDAHCQYCYANEFLCSTNRDARWPERKVIQHAKMDVDFNPLDNITTVTISDFRVQVPDAWVADLARQAHPTNWHDVAPTFFQRSCPAKRTPNGWEETAEWTSPSGGDLYEVTTWDWNDEMTAEMHNILSISDLQFEERNPRAISYKYQLNECLKSNMGIVWEEGGLDVDEGYYGMNSYTGSEYQAWAANAPSGEGRKPDTVNIPEKCRVMVINAQKRVRYTTPRIGPELGTVLNLMAPALVSMLMRRLVLESAEPPALDKGAS